MYDAPLGAVWPPHSAHGVVVSLPLLAHVIGYETGEPAVCAAMTSGYPRFVQHGAVGALGALATRALAERRPLPAASSVGAPPAGPLAAYVVTTATAAAGMVSFVGGSGGGAWWPAGELLPLPAGADAAVLSQLYVVGLPSDDPAALARAKAYLQHTGARVSSRQAQDALAALTGDASVLAREPALGVTDAEAAAETVRGAVAAALEPAGGAPAPGDDDVTLTNSGMAAFMALFGAVGALWEGRWARRRQGAAPAEEAPACGCAPRDLWLQLGWLYLDTAEVIAKFGGSGPARGRCARCTAADEGALAALAMTLPPGTVEFDLARGYVRVFDVTDLGPVRAVLQAVGARVAAVLTECPTNPLVQSCDLPSLAALARAAGAVLVVDPTVGGLGNASAGVLPHADAVPLSTTKYAAGDGDVMSGALVLNPGSGFYRELRAALAAAAAREEAQAAGGAPPGHPTPATASSPPLLLLRPYRRDLCALAEQVARMPALVAAINANTVGVARWLEGQRPGVAGGSGLVRAVHWAYAPRHAANYAALARGGGGGGGGGNAGLAPGCMITFELTPTWPQAPGGGGEDGGSDDTTAHAAREAALAAFYDGCPVIKGPSFGTGFTIMTPFMYLAHFDQASTPGGRAGLRARGVNPYLLRLSVGAEPLEDIVGALRAGLDALAAHLAAGGA